MRLRSENKYKNDISLEDYVSYDGDGVLRGVQIKDWSDRPDEVALNKEVIEIIERAVSDLPEFYTIALHLRDVEGFTNY